MTFKELKKKIAVWHTRQQTRLFELEDKPFWIWNIEEHREQDINTRGLVLF